MTCMFNDLKTLEIYVLKDTDLIQQNLFQLYSSMFCSYLAQLFAYTLLSHQNINFKKYQCDF